MRNEVIKVETQAEVLKAKAFFNARYGDKIKDNFDDWGGFTHVGIINGVFSYFTLSDINKTGAKVRVFKRTPLKAGDYVEVTGDGGHNSLHMWSYLDKHFIKKGQKHVIQDVDYKDDGFGDYTVKINDRPYRADYLKVIDNVPISLSKFKKIKPFQAQGIIDIACPEWKERLFSIWGKKIVMKEDIEISESEYKDMRNACTESQHVVFNNIFGKETKFKIGDWVTWLGSNGITAQIIREGGYTNGTCWVLNEITHNSCNELYLRLATKEEILSSIKKTYPIGTYVYFLEDVAERLNLKTSHWSGVKILQVKGYIDDNLVFSREYSSNRVDCFRLATKEEIKSVTQIPKGTPCVVRNFNDFPWKLYYADGLGDFFSNGNKDYKSDRNSMKWKQVIRLDEVDISNLPE